MGSNNRRYTVGVLRDWSPEERTSEAQTAAKRLLDAVPPPLDVVVCRPGQVRTELDAYVSFQVTRYTDQELEFLTEHERHIRLEPDWWLSEEPQSRWRNPLAEAAAVTCYWSPLQAERNVRVYEVHPRRTEIIPCPLDADKYDEVRQNHADEQKQKATLWAGEWHPNRGNDLMLRWAERNERAVHAYGPGIPLGRFSQFVTGMTGFATEGQWVDTMASYGSFIYFPRVPDTFGTPFMEAYLLGLEMTYNGEIGCLSFDKPLEALAQDCAAAPARFWSLVQEVLS